MAMDGTSRILALVIGSVTFTSASSGAAPAVEDRPRSLNVSQLAAEWRSSLEHGEVASFMIFGDSLVFRPDSLNWFFRDQLEKQYGNAGDGYLGLSLASWWFPGVNHLRPGLEFRYSPTGAMTPWWSELSGPRDDNGRRSPDGYYVKIGTPEGWAEYDFYGPDATLHYIREPGAGMIQIEVNGAVIAAVDASLPRGEPQLATYTFKTGQADPAVLNTLRLTIPSATRNEPHWTQCNGLHMRTGNTGSMYHRVGRGGVGPDDYLTIEPAIFAQFMQAVAPDIVMIMMDPSAHPDQYTPEMNEFVDRIDAAVPGTPIILITHHDWTPSMSDYADQLLAIAEERELGFINLVDVKTLASMQSNGFLDDFVHLSAVGGAWFGDYLKSIMQGQSPPSSPPRPSQQTPAQFIPGP
jgi:hypothetical protein